MSMHINYRGMLPESRTCDHDNVDFTVDQPNGKDYVLVSVGCKNCPATVENAQVKKL